MNPDELAWQLHDKAPRGVLLSPAVQTLLQEWYGRQDEQGTFLLAHAASPTVPPLQAQGNAAIVQLGAITPRIQIAATENEVMR